MFCCLLKNLARFLVIIALAVAPSFAAGLETGSAPGTKVPVRFTAPGKGIMSLAAYDADGVLVRSLLHAQAIEAGAQTVTWDATTDLGLPVKAGTYQVKGIFFTERPSLQYVMTVGKSGNPPWRTPDGSGDWGGNLGGPSAICSNGRSLIMVWSCVEDNQVTGVQQMDNEGRVQLRYFTFYPWDTRCAGVMDETNFYLGIENWQAEAAGNRRLQAGRAARQDPHDPAYGGPPGTARNPLARPLERLAGRHGLDQGHIIRQHCLGQCPVPHRP